MGWLKDAGKALWMAVLAFLAFLAVMAASRQKKSADAWKDKAVDIETGNVVKGVETAKAAMTQAQLHEQKAEAIKQKAEARINKIGEKDEATRDILDRWRA